MKNKSDFTKSILSLVSVNSVTFFALFAIVLGMHSEGLVDFEDSAISISVYLIVKSILLMLGSVAFYFYGRSKTRKRLVAYCFVYGVVLFIGTLIAKGTLPTYTDVQNMSYGDIFEHILLLNVDVIMTVISSIVFSVYAYKRHYVNARKGIYICMAFLLIYAASYILGWTT